MTNERESGRREPSPTSEAKDDPRAATRRHFLYTAGKKAAYMTPIVVALSASQVAAASGFDSTCGETGSPCTADPDCCGVLTCVAMSCA